MKKLPISGILKTALAITAITATNAFAGTQVTSGKEVKPVVEEEKPWITGTLDAGYDSRLYFRGLWFADHTVWTAANASFTLAENLTLGVGAYYVSTADTEIGVGPSGELDYSELDLFASLTYDFKAFKVGVVYTSYHFFDTYSGSTDFGSFGAGEYSVKHVNELGVVVSTSLWGANITGGFYYDFNIGGSYAELGVDYPIKVTDWLSIVPAVKTGYGWDYYSNGAPENGGLSGGVTSGFTHVLLSASAPITIAKNCTLTPYVSYNISGRARQSNNTIDNECFGGAKLSVSF